MGLFRRRPDDDRTWGMRFTESFLPVLGPASIRLVTHYHVSMDDVDRAADAIAAELGSAAT